MFKLKRKKGQGAIEYLFMIAAALVIILIAVRYVSNTGSQASNQGDLAMLQSQAELVKASFTTNGWWDDTTTKVKLDDTTNPTTLKLTTDGGTNYKDYTIPDKYKSGLKGYLTSEQGIVTVYNDCMQGNIGACEVFGILSGSSS